MPVLALDTSAAVAVALVTDDGAPLAARRVTEERRHAELLGPMIAEVLRDAGVDRGALTALVVGTGPAPFTGLRVGLVTARTLGLALGVPVLGVCSLDAVALQAADDGGLAPGAEVLVLTDARRREVYWARYRVTGGPDVDVLAGPAVARPGQLAEDGVADRAVVVGRGTQLYPDVLPAAAAQLRDRVLPDRVLPDRVLPDRVLPDRVLLERVPLDPEPAVLARIALARRARGLALPSEPLYLRRPDVMEPGTRKRALG